MTVSVTHVRISTNVTLVPMVTIQYATRMPYAGILPGATIVVATSVTLVTVLTVKMKTNVTVTYVTNRPAVSTLMGLINALVTKDLKAMDIFVKEWFSFDIELIGQPNLAFSLAD